MEKEYGWTKDDTFYCTALYIFLVSRTFRLCVFLYHGYNGILLGGTASKYITLVTSLLAFMVGIPLFIYIEYVVSLAYDKETNMLISVYIK